MYLRLLKPIIRHIHGLSVEKWYASNIEALRCMGTVDVIGKPDNNVFVENKFLKAKVPKKDCERQAGQIHTF